MVSLITLIACLQAQVQELEEKLKRLEQRVQELEEKPAPEAPPQPQRPNLLNPAITVFGNGAARIDSDNVLNASGTERVEDRFFLRTMELDIRSAIDPYAEGVFLLALEGLADGSWEADVEEAYALIKRLPILEEAPLGLKLKIGRFRAPLGQDNRLHMHDLPWTTRPLPVAMYLGTEEGEFFESGWAASGAEAEFLLPTLAESMALEVTAGVVRAGETALTEDLEASQPGAYARLNAFFDLGRSLTFNAGISGYREWGGQEAALGVFDWMLKWRPPERGTYTSLIVGGEAFYGPREFRVDDDGDGILDRETNDSPFGYFVYAQVQLDWHWFVGARLDWAEDKDDDTVETRVLAAYVSYYTTEYLRFRVGYEHRDSDIPDQDELNSVFLEVSWVFGSHPVEPYWVAR